MFKKVLLLLAVVACGAYATKLQAQCPAGNMVVMIGGSSSGSPLSGSAAVSSDYNGADISCNLASTGPNNDGKILVTPQNGTSPYEYKMSFNGGTYTTYTPPQALPYEYTGLVAGTYVFMIRDANGCVITTNSVDIVAPPAFVAGTCNVDPDQCQLNEGELDVSASGGTGVVLITWTSSCSSGSPAGMPGTAVPNTGTFPNNGGTVHYTMLTGNCTYNFVATDANGCVVQ